MSGRPTDRYAGAHCYDCCVTDTEPDRPVGPSPLPELPATSWMVLGMLAFNEEVSGYDIKKWADWTIGHFFWSPSYSQVYSELKRIEKLGLVSSRMHRDADARGRRMYKITRAGSDAVRRWVREAPVDQPVLKHGVLLRVWLGHMNNPTRLREILTEHMTFMESRRSQVAVDARIARAEAAWAYPRVTMLWAERHYAAERDLAAQMIADIEEAAMLTASVVDADGEFRPPPPDRWRAVEAQYADRSGTVSSGVSENSGRDRSRGRRLP